MPQCEHCPRAPVILALQAASGGVNRVDGTVQERSLKADTRAASGLGPWQLPPGSLGESGVRYQPRPNLNRHHPLRAMAAARGPNWAATAATVTAHGRGTCCGRGRGPGPGTGIGITGIGYQPEWGWGSEGR